MSTATLLSNAFAPVESVQYVAAVLARATDQSNSALIAEANATLVQLESTPGFFSALQLVALSRDAISNSIRMLAVMYCKNNVEHVWRQSTTAPMAEQERESFRQTSMALLTTEDDPLIALQCALVVARIARFDYPAAWPDFLNSLFAMLQTAEHPDLQNRLLLAVRYFVKGLLSNRSPRGVATLARVSTLLFDQILQVYRSVSEATFPALIEIVQAVHAEAGQAVHVPNAAIAAHVSALQLALSCIKLLSYMFLHGLPASTINLAADAPQGILVQLCCSQSVQLAALVPFLVSPSNAHPPPAAALVIQCLKTHTKILTKGLVAHPLPFIPLLPTLLSHFTQQLMTVHDATLVAVLPSFVLQVLTFFVSIFTCDVYYESGGKSSSSTYDTSDRELEEDAPSSELAASWTTPPSSSTSDARSRAEAQRAAAQEAISSFMVPQTVATIASVLILKFFRLTEVDFEAWDAAPEEFMSEHSTSLSDRSLTRIKPSAEWVLHLLVTHYSESIIPLLTQMLQDARGLPEEMESIFYRDCVFAAVGVCAYDLFDHLDFDQMFMNDLVPQFAVNQHRLVRRRAILLVNQWIDVRLNASLRVVLYENLIPLLSDDDTVVRLEAMNTLLSAVGAYEFDEDEFIPFIRPSINALVLLMSCADFEVATQSQALTLISTIISRCSSHVSELSLDIAAHFFAEWQRQLGRFEALPMQQAAEVGALLGALLPVFTGLVQAMQSASNSLHATISRVLSVAMDREHRLHVYTELDAIQLWSAVVTHASVPTREVLSIFPVILEYLTSDSIDTLSSSLEIVVSYLHLDAASVFSAHGMQLCQVLNQALETTELLGTSTFLPLLDMLLHLFPADAIAYLRPSLLHLMGLFFSDNDDYLPSIANLSVLFARIMLENNAAFVQLIQTWAVEQNNPLLLQSYTIQASSIARKIPTVKKKKLACMALLSCIGKPEYDLTQCLTDILLVSADAFQGTLVQDIDDQGQLVDQFIMTSETDAEMDQYSAETRRIRQYRLTDPVHTVPLDHALQVALAAGQQQFGETFMGLVQQCWPQTILDHLAHKPQL
ncbi:hypothetical protein CAOG_02786 [Capsaspora owczarzaki ATCC 30864]|uniref:Importin N-terminal domain-containing protein n=1 Tax=Capsaspora owczarzaki (strain ATCC 30864) TaxID=595528 RepID=A0A0D2WLX7_CAPO3|nr:hypothetical protein CAOG_02786 [Capsaspora owczarzaki ATCC 30864]KJE91685.1 hypothetical protein CAOG_002786 [Capsaspora owczarzaki ATCC 30864]|eukprot:XP_004349539.1 hypothetical protein CAOG_02786 [Capsaspora owczarzaki ATCC 30864]